MIAQRKPVSSSMCCSEASHPDRTSFHSDNSTAYLHPSMTARILHRQIDWSGNFSLTKCYWKILVRTHMSLHPILQFPHTFHFPDMRHHTLLET